VTLDWSDTAPTAEDYVALRAAAGMGKRSVEGARVALSNSLKAVFVRDQNDLVAMGRVVGDGGCFVQLVDIAVHPRVQGQGIGQRITRELVDWCEANLPETCHISLVASERAVKLYESFGFQMTRGMDRYGGVELRLTK